MGGSPQVVPAHAGLVAETVESLATPEPESPARVVWPDRLRY
jgi:hypothetical protein